MSFPLGKIRSCVGGKQRSAATNIWGDTTSKGIKILIGHCSICNRKNQWLFLITQKQQEA